MEAFKQNKYFYAALLIPISIVSYKIYLKLTQQPSDSPPKKAASTHRHISIAPTCHPTRQDSVSHYDSHYREGSQKFSSSKSLRSESILIQNLLDEKYWEHTNQPQSYLYSRMVNQSNYGEIEAIFGYQLNNILCDISLGYNKIAYHNITHAFDVATCLDQILTNGLKNRLKLSEAENAICLIAAYAHDINHKGLSDSYYRNSHHEWCQNYGYDSTLQKMHIRSLFEIFDCYELVNLSMQNKKMITEMILSTDNTFHKRNIQKIQDINSKYEEIQSEKEKEEFVKVHKFTILGMSLHFADLNNCAKDIEVFMLWSSRLFREFEIQAEIERKSNLPITYTTNISEVEKNCAQHGFIKNMVFPLFCELLTFDLDSFLQFSQGLEKNLEYYRKKKGKIRRQSA